MLRYFKHLSINKFCLNLFDVSFSFSQAQARECLFEKLQLQAREACRGRDRELRDDTDMCLDLSQESAQLAHTYNQLYEKVIISYNYVLLLGA